MMPSHEFTLIHVTGGFPWTDQRYDSIKANPPSGCEPEDMSGRLSLWCRREASNLLIAVAETCREVQQKHGFMLDDLAVEKVWEFAEDGRDGFGATIVGQLLLMALARGPRLGYTTEDLVRFIRRVGSAR